MNARTCRIKGCTVQSNPRSPFCSKHRHRIRRYGDPHFSAWTVADPQDVELIARERRPADGLTRLEQRLVGLRMSEQGASVREISEVLAVTPRTVHRWRSAQRAGRRPGGKFGAVEGRCAA